MKKCDYCGKEYGDDVNRCAVDGQPLTGAAEPGALPPRLPPRLMPPPLPVGPGVAPPVLNTFSELERQVLAGGRFVVFQYCFSVLVMSFKRSSGVIYLPPGEDGAGQAVSNSMISLLAGWWGIPWGPIWTIATVAQNAGGGIDVTPAVLAEKVGSVRAAHIMSQRRVNSSRSRGMKWFRAGLIGLVVLPFLLLVAPIIMSAFNATSRTGSTVPGRAQFQAANAHLNGNPGFVGCGNTPRAVDVADAFSKKMKQRRELFFEAAKSNQISVGTREFVSCCEVYDSQCAIIVHIPDLRRFNSDAKESLGHVAWITAQEVLQETGKVRPGTKLAVGLRGVLLYDRVLLGNIVTNLESGDAGLVETVVNGEPEKRLYPFFQRPALASDTGEALHDSDASAAPTNQ